MFRIALLILSGNAATSLMLLARNLIVARLIPVEDYGIAATFAVIMAMVEMASAFGLQQQIVQSRRGDDTHFQAVLQGFQVLRGLLAGIVLFAIAGPIARFLGVPEVIWAYQVLALVPVMRAFVHFDIHRLNRQMRFWPLILTSGVPALMSLVLIWPLVAWLGDWRVMLFGILIQSGLAALTSHLVAEQRYRLAFDPKVVKGALNFGWPILVNAVLLFFVFQGDKLIVGRVLGMTDLAVFALGMTLTLTPTLVLAKSAQNYFLARLSKTADTPQFARIASHTLQVVTGAAFVFLLTVVLIGGPVLHILLGPKYVALVPLLAWFAIGQALRLVKVGPAVVALSLGHTSNAMWANSLRVAVLPLTWIVAGYTGSLLHVLWLAIAGEAAGVLLAMVLLARRSNMTAAAIFAPQLPLAAACAGLTLWVWTNPPTPTWPGPTEWAAAMLLAGITLALMPGIRSLVRSKVSA